MNDTTFTIPTAEELRKQIGKANDKAKQPIRDEVAKVVEAFAKHIQLMLANPERFTSSNVFGYDHPRHGTTDADKKYFYECLQQALPVGYRVEASHDGGGMYEVAIIRWDEVKPTVNRTTRRGATVITHGRF